ncbi:MAG: TIGR02266 family protein [Deltaproteobacteria bacterium]|nr:TIGR02266 family protein [Deltaproteobacteria bacterium]
MEAQRAPKSSAESLALKGERKGKGSAEFKPGGGSKGKLTRREHLRAALKTKVGFSTESNFYAGFTDDVSEGGLFVATHQLLPLGTVVALEFSCVEAGSDLMSVSGRVRWVRDEQKDGQAAPGMGVQFIDLSDEDRGHIETFVKRRDPIFYEPAIEAPTSEGEGNGNLEHLQGPRWKAGVVFGLAILIIVIALVTLFAASGD